MKKGLAILLSALVLLGAAAFALWELRFSPTGVFNPGRPSVLMDTMLETTSREAWRDLLYEAWEGQLTPFEDRAAVFDGLLAHALTGELGFRRDEGEDSFILCTPERDLAKLRFSYSEGVWSLAETEVLLSGETHTITILVPENVVPTVNGIPLGSEYITDTALPYGDMTEQELQFPGHPVRWAYTVEGLYACPTVEAEGTAAVYCRGNEWSFEPTDARSYSLRIQAPADAKVTVNGYTLGEKELTGTESLTVDVDLPEEKTAALPVNARYALSGLYTAEHSVEAWAADGTPLSAAEVNGVLCFDTDRSRPPEGELEALATEFISELCLYGAGMRDAYAVCRFVPADRELYNFLYRAQGSLFWIRGTQLTLQEVKAGEYIMADDNTCVCTARAAGSVKNYYMTYEAEFAVQLLCERTENGWMVTDMAYE